MSDDRPRLIEVAFPLKQASLDSVHEKNVRHGHISTLHIWPARRPLAACRAALIATLLPDPGNNAERKRLLERLAGHVVTRNTVKRVEGREIPVLKEETEGGILHWGRENGPDLEFFRQQIRQAYGGRAPRVLDPFAGGGAIPLEAMRLGCEVTASDINPVAWFILKCTLEYPQRLAGQTWPLTLRPSAGGGGTEEGRAPTLPLWGGAWSAVPLPSPSGRGPQGEGRDPATAAPPLHGARPAIPEPLLVRARELRRQQTSAEALLWELLRDRQLLGAKFRRQHPIGPYIADFYCHQPRLIVELDGPVHQGQAQEDAARQAALEAQGYRMIRFANERVRDETVAVLEEIAWAMFPPGAPDLSSKLASSSSSPLPLGEGSGVRAGLADHVRAWGHWVLERARRDLERFYPVIDGKPTVAYLWARTVACKNCRATIPLLKTLWLCRKEKKRVHLQMKPRPDRSGVDFAIVHASLPSPSGRGAGVRARGEGPATMTRSGAWCPVCGGPGTVAMTLADIRAEGMAGRLGAQMTAVVVSPTSADRSAVGPASLPSPSGRGTQGEGKGYRLPTPEELEAAQEAAGHVEAVFRDVPFGLPTEPLPTKEALGFRVPLYGMDQWYKLFTPRQLVALGTFVKHTRSARDAMRAEGYPPDWVEAVSAYLAVAVDRLADYNSTVCHWHLREYVVNTFQRFALPINWDYSEIPAISLLTGGYNGAIEWISLVTQHAATATSEAFDPGVVACSATDSEHIEIYDVVLTDPPYYDAIPYSDLMDFFYVWLRRTLQGLAPEIDEAFDKPLGPKWNHATNDGELIDDASRFGGSAQKAKAAYEDGMFRTFRGCQEALAPDGRMVIVFANKQPDAWETLVSSMIRAGFVVGGSWPIQTEMGNRTRALTSAALSSSVWLVCRKRPETARPGWDTQVLEEMRARIYDRLRDFWDAGIRGPDFVWAATGPALEAYSKHPIVKKAGEPNSLLTVPEFLREVRRVVVDYVVGRVLSLTPASGHLSPPGREEGEGRDRDRPRPLDARPGAEREPPLPSPPGRGTQGEGIPEGLDDLTIYYLLHRHDFGLDEAPVGASILYAQSCYLHDRDLVDRHDLLAYGKGRFTAEDAKTAEEDEGRDAEGWGEESPLPSPPGRGTQGEGPTSGSAVKLKRWDQRRGKDLGLNAGGRVSPLIDQVHRLMRLWRAGDLHQVDGYLEEQGLRRNPLFPRVLQALVELAGKDRQPDERVLLETIMNHVTARGPHPQMRLFGDSGGL